MSDYEFGLASEADDAELRCIIGSIPMPGSIEFLFRRDPNFFQALSCEGDWRQVLVVRSITDRHVVGCGVRSIRPRYVGNNPMPVGYLSSLRLDPRHRRAGLVRRGYRFLHRMHQDQRTPFYLTTIAKGNAVAEKLLTAGVGDMPRYHPYGRYFTLAIAPRHFHESSISNGILVRPATDGDTDDILNYLNSEGAKRTFANYYPDAVLFGNDNYRCLEPSDVLLAIRGKKLVGVMGGWDQHSFRQVVVHRYNGALRYFRGFYDFYQRLRGSKPLPKEGEPFRYRFGALCLVKDWDEAVFKILLKHQLTMTKQGQYHYFLLGMHETDPLLRMAQKFAVVQYVTNLYIVNWGPAPEFCGNGSGPVHLELGSL